MDEVRKQLITALTTSQAHGDFASIVADFPMDRINDKAPHSDYTAWRLLEHIRRTQKDILDFMVEPVYKERQWPKDYWPEEGVIADETMWHKTIDEYQEDMKNLIKLVEDKATDLSSKVKNGDGQTIAREIIMVIDHNAYHLGEFSILRQVMGTWPKNHNK